MPGSFSIRGLLISFVTAILLVSTASGNVTIDITVDKVTLADGSVIEQGLVF